MRIFKFSLASVLLLGILSCDSITDKIRETAEDKVKKEIQKKLDEQNISLDSTQKLIDSIMKSVNTDSIMMSLDSTLKNLESLKREIEKNKN